MTWFTHLVRTTGEALWRTKTMLVQAGSHVALVHRGRLLKVRRVGRAPRSLSTWVQQQGAVRALFSCAGSLMRCCRAARAAHGPPYCAGRRTARPPPPPAFARVSPPPHPTPPLQSWDIEGSPAARAVPAILEVSPPLLLASQPEQLRVSGLNMLQNDCQLLLRLQGRYIQPAATHCGDCSCAAPVHPASGAGPAGQLAAAAAASSFEQRCCGCCTDKLQLVGLLPRLVCGAADGNAAAGEASAAAAAAEPPTCCKGGPAPGTPSAVPPAAPPPCCQAKQQQQPEQERPEQPSAAAAAGSPPAPAGAGRKVLAGAARLQSLRLQLPSQEQREAAGQPALPPGLLHLDIARRAYMAPRGAYTAQRASAYPVVPAARAGLGCQLFPGPVAALAAGCILVLNWRCYRSLACLACSLPCSPALH